jgi:hypothetical protein
MIAYYSKKKRANASKKSNDWRGIIRAIRHEARLQQRIKKRNKYDIYVQLFY